MIRQISPRDLKRWLEDDDRPPPTLLDVREAWELGICRIDGVSHIPMRNVPLRVHELNRTAECVVVCHHGARSFQVAMYLEREGFDKLYNLTGGMAGWAREVDPQMATY
jgi:rhodanese-related sulfurtransferase